jgi:hypothetical protein
MLGTMIGMETELAHRFVAEPCPQALDPLCAALAMTMGSGKEIAILPRERRDFFRDQTDRLDPVGQLFARQTLAQHIDDVLDFARRGKAEHDRGRSCVLVYQVAAQPRDAGTASLQESGELDDQPLGGEQQRLGFGHRHGNSSWP